MSKTTFSNKCEILGMLWTFYKDTEDAGWQEFFTWADLGCPLAYMSWQGLASLKPEAKELVESTWVAFCEVIEIDPNAKYENLADTFDSSSHEVLAV